MTADDDECVVNIVSALSGESLSRFRLPRSSQVLKVKHCVQAEHNTGVFCQHLLLWPAGRSFEDHEVLATLPGLAIASYDAQLEPLALAIVRLEYVDADLNTARQL
eukprot:13478411-Heterocapsa_arctica.AAC.1